MYVRNRRTDRHHRFRRSGGSCYLSGDQEKEKIIPDCPKSPVSRKTGGCQKTAPLYYIFSCNLIQKLHRSSDPGQRLSRQRDWQCTENTLRSQLSLSHRYKYTDPPPPHTRIRSDPLSSYPGGRSTLSFPHNPPNQTADQKHHDIRRYDR